MKNLTQLSKYILIPFYWIVDRIKTRIQSMYGSTHSFLSNNSEYWKTILLGISLFLGFDLLGMIFNWSTYPVGVYQKIPFAVVSVAVFIVVSLFLLKALFPNMRDFIDKDNSIHFYTLETWQKFIFSLSVFSLLFWGMVKIASSL